MTKLRIRAFEDKPEMSMRELRPALNLFNVYERIVFKNKKGCAHYYRLLNESRMKYDCWSNARITHENEVFLHDKNFMYDNVISRLLRLQLSEGIYCAPAKKQYIP